MIAYSDGEGDEKGSVPNLSTDLRDETVYDRLGPRPPVAEMINWTLLSLDKESQSIHLSFTAAKNFTNPGGTVHGGFISAMLDECMGSAVVGLTEAEFLPVTISMTTDFIRPVLPGEVFGEGRITSMSGRSAFLEGRLTDPEGNVLARSVGSFRLFPFPDGVKK
ncbi:PaaI family thioesterase [Streptomyces rectiviolaceus]|uniref:PaaI family thioesterase n=1 Tax=Streptomyces rectiviolaceus TaxID=332591 RepID=A0ABP6MPY6_9ACTN